MYPELLGQQHPNNKSFVLCLIIASFKHEFQGLLEEDLFGPSNIIPAPLPFKFDEPSTESYHLELPYGPSTLSGVSLVKKLA